MITIDFETYYNTGYSLTSLTIEEYVRNNEFCIIGVAVKVDAENTVFHTGTTEELRGALAQYNWNQPVLAHNAYFDLFILNYVFDIRPRFILDTMCMAKPYHMHSCGVSLGNLSVRYGLGEKLEINSRGWKWKTMSPEQRQKMEEYCINDAELTYKLYHTIKDQIPVRELAVIDKTIRMFTEPCVQVNIEFLKEYAEGIAQERDTSYDEVWRAVLAEGIDISFDQFQKSLRSTNKFVDLLLSIDHGLDIPLKSSPTNLHKLIPALAKTDAGMQLLLSNDNILVQKVAELRLESKSVLNQTRAARLIGCGIRGALPIYLGYYNAHTGRYGGGEKLNLQNLPRGGKLRYAIVAPPGYKIVASDSSQIEARINAWLARQMDLLEQFRLYDKGEGESPYEVMASRIYGRKITKADKLERFVGKTCVLGLGYGMGHIKLQSALRIGQGGISVELDIQKCAEIVKVYREFNHKIKQLWKLGEISLGAMLQGHTISINGILKVDNNGIHLPNGMMLRYNMLHTLPPHLHDGTDTWGSTFKYCNNAKLVPAITYKKLQGERYEHLLTYIYGAKVIENVVQALARIAVVEQMLLINRRYKVIFQVHDENVCIVKENEVEEATAYIKKIMTTPPSWASDLPINCEVGVGLSYGDC